MNLYDKDDNNTGSCKDFFKELEGSRTLSDHRLKSGKGDKMATASIDTWLKLAISWVE